jgi:hypothetical protein
VCDVRAAANTLDFEVSQLRRDAQNLKTSECIGLFVREGQLLIKTTTFIVLHGRYRFSSALFDRYAKKLSLKERDTEVEKYNEGHRNSKILRKESATVPWSAILPSSFSLPYSNSMHP